MLEIRSQTSDKIPDHAVCFWQQDGSWHAAHRDHKPGDPIGRGADFESALRALQVNRLHRERT